MSSLDQIVEELKKQNSTLESTKDSIQRMLSEDINARKARERAAGREEENRREARQQRTRAEPTTFKGGLVQGAKQATGFNFLEDVASWGKSILAGLFGGVTAGAIAAGLGALVSRGAIFGGAAYLVGQFGERIFTDFFKSLDPKEIYLKADDRALLAASMSDAVSSGLVGLIFGKKAAIAAFVGSLIGDGLTKLLNLSDTERMKIFGMDLPISEADFATYGAMVAAYFGPGLIGSALSRAFTGQDVPPGATVGRDARGRFTKLKPSLRKTFMANFKPRVGWAAVIGTAGSLLANYIGDMTGSEELGDVANWTTMGTTMGMMFGPQGALIGALLGFTFSAGSFIIDHLGKLRRDNLAKINKEIDRLQAEAQDAIDKGDFETAKARLAQAGAEGQRLAQLTTQSLGAEQGIETAEARVDLAKYDSMSKGQKVNAATELFSQAMKSQESDDVKVEKAVKALALYTQVTKLSRREALDELIGQIGGIGPAQGRALNLRSAILTQSRPALSSRLDRKGGTPLPAVVAGAAGGSQPSIVINAPTQNTAASSSATVQTENTVSARDSVNYNIH